MTIKDIFWPLTLEISLCNKHWANWTAGNTMKMFICFCDSFLIRMRTGRSHTASWWRTWMGNWTDLSWTHWRNGWKPDWKHSMISWRSTSRPLLNTRRMMLLESESMKHTFLAHLFLCCEINDQGCIILDFSVCLATNLASNIWSVQDTVFLCCMCIPWIKHFHGQ